MPEARISTPIRGQLRIRDLDHHPLRSFTLDIDPGELVGVVAIDPADSSALVRCLGREEESDDGWVELDGVRLTDLPPADTRTAIVSPTTRARS